MSVDCVKGRMWGGGVLHLVSRVDVNGGEKKGRLFELRS